MKIIDFRGDLIDISLKKEALHTMGGSTCAGREKMYANQWSFFQNENNFFLGYFDPVSIFFDSKNKYFPGWPKRYFGENGNTDADVSVKSPENNSFMLWNKLLGASSPSSLVL